MVQIRHFGDDRDYFKHDLISWIVEKSSLRNLVYVPMLTEHRDNQEGDVEPDATCNRSGELLYFIKGYHNKSLDHWRKWYCPKVANYQTVEPVDEIFFKHDTRTNYWKKFDLLVQRENALVFIDPDTGLETQNAAYMQRMGFDKYILNLELLGLYRILHESSALMIYQHLPYDNRIHIQQVNNRLQQIARVCLQSHIIAYRENDLAFLFITKSDEIFSKMQNCLEAYYDKSKHRSKTPPIIS